MPEIFGLCRPARLLSFLTLALAAGIGFGQAPSNQNQPSSSGIVWHKGPYLAKLGSAAELKVPAGYEFADGDGARRYLELTHNPAEGTELGIITPVGNADADNWDVFFDFDETGFVKDDEKSSIDATKLLESIKSGTEEANEERRKKGWEPFHITGWKTQPFYDQATHNLTWATVGRGDNPKEADTVNYASRVLGRHGVMRTDLVIDPSQTAAVGKFNELMNGFSFTTGSRYADFVKGDKVAEYGLTALIAGGATAVALKTGLFAKLLGLMVAAWKVIVVAFAAVMTRIKSIVAAIRRKFGNGGDESAA
jgi:uncharacterized membrane-anchored protein